MRELEYSGVPTAPVRVNWCSGRSSVVTGLISAWLEQQREVTAEFSQAAGVARRVTPVTVQRTR